MALLEFPRGSAAPLITLGHSLCPAPPNDSAIIAETAWRTLPAREPGAARTAITVSRWQSPVGCAAEVTATTEDDAYILAITLRRMDVRFSVDGRIILDGTAMPGTLHLTEPGSTAQCLFRGAFDVLHIRLPLSLVQECAQRAPDNQLRSLYSRPKFNRDPIVERLAVGLLDADEVGGSFAELYSHCLGIAIISRLLELRAPHERSDGGSGPSGLLKWRLRRALDFIDSHLDQPLRLADIAAAAGLSRMHFAVQFRATMGVSPHDYVLRRRIERAQEMLRRADGSLVEIALGVGFQTQPHFTTVFKRIVGVTPHAWRQAEIGPRPGWAPAYAMRDQSGLSARA